MKKKTYNREGESVGMSENICELFENEKAKKPVKNLSGKRGRRQNRK